MAGKTEPKQSSTTTENNAKATKPKMVGGITGKGFKPGQSGNPKGYPKGVPHSSTRLKRFLELTEKIPNPITKELEEISVAEQLDLAQIIKARKGDTMAFKAILDRLEGRPTETFTGEQKITVETRVHGRADD